MKKLKAYVALLLVALMAAPSWADRMGFLLEEADGSPAGYVIKLKMPNGSISDLSSATGTIDLSALGGGTVNGVGDCTTSADCFDGTSDGGTYLRLYDGTSSYTSITGGVRAFTVASGLANAEAFTVTLGDNNDTITVTSGTGANSLVLSSIGLTVGGTLALGANNLTMTGSLGATGSRLTQGWFTNLEITNTPTVNGVAANASSGLILNPLTTQYDILVGGASGVATRLASSANVHTFLGSANTAAMQAALSVDDLVTLSGVADGATNLGTFTGSTIADSQTIKAALQSLETAIEGVTGLTENSIDQVQLKAIVALADGDLFDLSGITMTGAASEGFVPPTWADVTPSDNKHYLSYDATGKALKIHDTGGGYITLSASGSGAPADAKYIVQAGDATLSAEQVLTAGAGTSLTLNTTPDPDTLTIALNPAGYTGNQSWSSGSADSTITVTYNLSSGTDPVWTYTSGIANLSAGTLQVGGVGVASLTAPAFTTSITPASAGASTIGTTALEWGNLYLTDGAVIYGQANQSNSLTSSATGWTAALNLSAAAFVPTSAANSNGEFGYASSAFSWQADSETLTATASTSGNTWTFASGTGATIAFTPSVALNGGSTVTTAMSPTTAGGSTLGTTALEWGNVYLTNGAIIYGQADQSNTLTSAATGWTANLELTARSFIPTAAANANGEFGYATNAFSWQADSETMTATASTSGNAWTFASGTGATFAFTPSVLFTGGATFSAAATPTTNDVAALGSTSLMWSDLFLASGGVINFNNNDVTVTHSSNALAFAGASSGYSFDAAVTVTGAAIPGTADTYALGSATAEWSNLYLGDGAIIYGQNDQSATLTASSGKWTANALDVTGAMTAGTISGGAGGFAVDADGDTTAKTLTITGASGSPGYARVLEDPAYGTNYRGFSMKDATDYTTSWTIDWPGGDPTAYNFVFLHAPSASKISATYGSFSASRFTTTSNIVDLVDNGVTPAKLYALSGTPGASTVYYGDGHWGAVTAAASGSDGYIQIASSGVLGSDAGLAYNTTTQRLTLGKSGTTGGLTLLAETGATDYTYTLVPSTSLASNITTTLPSSALVAGDLLYSSTNNQMDRLAKGTAYQILGMNSGATAPAWTSTLGATGTRLTAGYFTDLAVTNAITGSVTGNAGTVTVADAADDTTTWPMLATGATGSLAPATDSSLTYNASSGLLSTTALTLGGTLTLQNSETITNADDTEIAFNGTEALALDLDTGTGNQVTWKNRTTSSTGITDMSFSAFNLVTTGTIQGGIVVDEDADGKDAAAMSAVGMYGTLFVATGAGTWILPTAVKGMAACLMDSGTAHDLILDVTAGSTIRLKGTEQADGVGITNASGSTTGDQICVVAVAAGKWSTIGGGTGTWVSQ